MIRDAASIILLRQIANGFEVFLVRRHHGASFMASASVFPGGAAEPGEDARTAGARELFEEAGVLLAETAHDVDFDTLETEAQDVIRRRVLDGTPASVALAQSGLTWSTKVLVPWSHWITPSVETKRFSAQFFVVGLPAGQDPTFDPGETVDQVWVTPRQAIERAAELALPPPQLRTFWELARYTSTAAVMVAGRARGHQPHPIMPRLMPGERPCLLLPWDPDYLTKGTGESTPLTYQPSWANGPSRFVSDGKGWQLVEGAS